MEKTFVKIKRQGHPEKTPYWEEFLFVAHPELTVTRLLKEIQKRPVNTRGEAVTPIVWDSSCLAEECLGACSMLMNDKPGLACQIFLNALGKKIVLEPMTKFPVVRDLLVDRSKMNGALMRVQDWHSIDPYVPQGFSLQPKPINAEFAQVLSSCISCGLCLEVCPQYHKDSSFIGAQAISRAHLMTLQASAAGNFNRLLSLMEEGGIEDCGKAQNCQKICPQKIPLVDSIAAIAREVTKEAFKRIFSSI